MREKRKDRASEKKNTADFAEAISEDLDFVSARAVTNTFLLKKHDGDYQKNAKKVILSASEPLAFRALLPVLENLRKNPKCSAVALIADNVAGKYFKKYFSNDSGADKFVLLERPGDILNEKFDIALTTIDTYTNPKSLFYLARKAFWVKKLYVLHYSWTSLSIRKDMFKETNMIDGIFCNDNLAREIILDCVPYIAADKIFVTGTPIVEDLGLEKKDLLRGSGRDKLNIDNDEFVVLYLGDVGEDYKVDGAIDGQINKKTLAGTLTAIEKISSDFSEKKFVLMVRPHPRDAHRENLLLQTKAPRANLRIIPAHEEKVSIEEAVYAGDVVASIVSTENHLAPLRGRFGAFLAFRTDKGDKKLGERVLEKVYGKKMIEFIKRESGLRVVYSADELAGFLREIITNKIGKQDSKLIAGGGASVNKIIAKIFE